jgi:hypothetical protein
VAIVNFSVPDAVKRAFEREFAGENKSACIARLMMQAVEERARVRRRRAAVAAILGLRTATRPASVARVRGARRVGRP